MDRIETGEFHIVDKGSARNPIYLDESGRRYIDRSDDPQRPNILFIHPNGGGLVQDPASVDDTVWLGPETSVFDAEVRGLARLCGTAMAMRGSRIVDAEIDSVIVGDCRIAGPIRISSSSMSMLSGLTISVHP